MAMTMFGRFHIIILLAMLVPAAANAETKEEWIARGARVHGGFGPFIPVGIRIGIDALERLKAPRHEVIVTYYDAGLPPCPCIADGIMIATQATPAQKMMIFSGEAAGRNHGGDRNQEPQDQ
jgi:formylmethanofuran dehydrogenase subunit E